MYLSYRVPVNSPIFKHRMRIFLGTKRATIAFEDKVASSTASPSKETSKTARNRRESALKPIAVEPLPEIDGLALPPLPKYSPPLKLRESLSESIATGLSALHTVQTLYAGKIVDRIVNAINSYAENA